MYRKPCRLKRQFAFETLERRQFLSANPVLNEILASNSTSIRDEDGDFSDFIEIYNRGDATAHLDGWYLTDNASALTKWRLPAIELEPGQYMVIFASSKNRSIPGAALHTNFSLSAEGEYLALVQSDGVTIASQFAPQFPAQRRDVSYGVSIADQSLRFFPTPTPGAENGAGVIDFVPAAAASHEHGIYTASFMLDLSTSMAGASIYYTYNGSVPAADNPAAFLFTQPIEVNRSTVLRTRAYKADYLPSPIVTQSYLFLDSVLTQTIDPNNPSNNPFGLNYPAIWQDNVPGDFNVDPAIVSKWDDYNPSNNDTGIREALLSIPTMSIVMDHRDLWNTSNGIYPNSSKQGDAWDRAGSIEYINPLTGDEFQYQVGVQMHGDASRSNLRTKKHSFRLKFSDDYDGPGSLEFPIFEGTSFADFNTIVLKAAFTDSFATDTRANRYSPLEATYLRDVWMLDAQRAMGGLSPNATYVHLYINGLYWGLYYPVERTDDAFLASHIGGNREDWDVIKDFNELFRGSDDAWKAMFGLARQLQGASAKKANSIYHELQGRTADGSSSSGMPAYLDVDNFIDYMILHIYGGADDWPDHNWVAARNRVNPGKGFQFFTWDQEIALNRYLHDRTEVNDANTPGELYSLLRNSSEFRLRFADRVQKHLLNPDGALATQASINRWMERANQIDAAIIGESARWGDARAGEVVNLPPKTALPTITVDHWRNSVNEVANLFPQFHSQAVTRFAADGLLAPLKAPQFSQFGGTVNLGSKLTLSLPSGSPSGSKIYYTLDGTDPRLPGGSLSPSAKLYTGPFAFPADAHFQVSARIRSAAAWSPIVETEFVMDVPSGVVLYGGGTYQQSFDGLPPDGSQVIGGRGPHQINANLGTTELTGWTISNFGGSSTNTEFRAHDGSQSGGSGRGAISFGATGSGDRALGTLATSNQISRFGLSLFNTSGQTLDRFTLTYIGEQWRRGDVAAPNTLAFAYALGTADINTAVGFIDVPSLSFVSPNTQVSPINVALDGNAPAKQSLITFTVSGIAWMPGQVLTLRWTGQDQSGQDDGLAIDKLSFATSAPPTPSSSGNVIVLGSVGGENQRSRVKVIDPTTQQVITTFTPYGNSFRGDVHVAVADLDHDGIVEIITAPGAAKGRLPLVKAFDLTGRERKEFRIVAYDRKFAGGVFITTGDVDGDGYYDIITSPGSEAAAEVRVWRNRLNKGSVYVNDVFAANPYRDFLAYGSTFKGGATVAASDFTGDGRAEIVVGMGKGTSPRVRLFDLTQFKQTSHLRLANFFSEIRPFDSGDRGGVFVASGIVSDNGRHIIIGNGIQGRGEVEIYNSHGIFVRGFVPYSDFDSNAEIRNAPVHVALTNYDGRRSFEILTAQGSRSSRNWRIWESDAALADEALVGDDDFANGFFVA